jgi:mannose-6-phosphate isomerase-like protein (cupin superfamily)
LSARDYDIHLDVKYSPLQLIDVGTEAAAHEPWFNQTLTSVNDAVIRLGVLDGDFHWHKHDDQDEFFLVLEGRLLIDLEARDTVELEPNQGFTVPRGIVHRTRARGRTVVLMVEAAGVVPTGD